MPLSPSSPQGAANGTAPALLANAVCLSLTLHGMATRRKVSVATIDVPADVDKTWLRVSKLLLAAPELRAIERHDDQLRTRLMSLGLPSLFKAGTYLIPLTQVDTVQQLLDAAHAERASLVDAFVAAYPARLAEAQARLGSQYNPLDYPEPEALGARFTMSWSWVEFGVPGQLARISRQLYEQEHAKARAQWQEIGEQVTALLRAEAVALLEQLVSDLKGERDGKKKRFAPTTLPKIRDWLAHFEDGRNLTNDQALAGAMAEVKALLDGLDTHDICTDTGLRQFLAGQVQELTTTVQGLLEEQPRRVYVWEDEETPWGLAEQAQQNVTLEQHIAQLRALFTDPLHLPLETDQQLRTMERVNAVLHANLTAARQSFTTMLYREE